MVDKHLTYICKLVKTFEEVRDGGIGCFMFNRVGNIVLHTPDGATLDWNITRPENRPYWVYDGNRQRPTLSPALVVREEHGNGEVRECFHGYLERGTLRWVKS